MGKKKWKIPFTPDGHMIGNINIYNSYVFPAVTISDWRDVYKFKATMRIKNYYRGRTTTGIRLEDIKTKYKYDLSMDFFINIVDKIPIINGIMPELNWTFIKRGPRISLKLVEEKKNE